MRARAIQEVAGKPVMHVSLDMFTDMFHWPAVSENVRAACHAVGVANFHAALPPFSDSSRAQRRLRVEQNEMIRIAAPSDIANIAQLNGAVQRVHADHAPALFRQPTSDAAFIAWFAEASRKPTAFVLLAEESCEATGYLFADEVRKEETWSRPALRYFLLHHIVVAPAFQKRGVGGALMQAFIDEAKKRKISRVELDVWSFNEKAPRFFSRFGFSAFNYRMQAFVAESGDR